VTRTGWVRGLPGQAVELIAQFKEAGAARVNIAFRQGPYDWDALEAFASEVMPALA
jgi:alkanesulfonate monooxygenase SsuD/methylene tetrahydromethanopterin reductase-like flavin-dependent oxidoreductase (luciferase family)